YGSRGQTRFRCHTRTSGRETLGAIEAKEETMRLTLRTAQVALALSLATATVAAADPDCSKWCGINGAISAGTRAGCDGEGGVCFWVECNYGYLECGTYWNFNDDCYNPLPCYYM